MKKAVLAAVVLVHAVVLVAGWKGLADDGRTEVAGVSWHDSFDDARAEAKRTGKPILLFSMFGRIDEEMPCTNARTLRATLFQDPEFQKLMTSEVVPAWEMVRAVPRVTIDLGDGKKVERTVRGNAVMYLVNTDGKVIDAFPGVYTAQDFMPMIRESLKTLAEAQPATVIAYHKERGKLIPPTRITTGKMMMESPTLRMIGASATAGAKSNTKPETSAQSLFLRAAARLADASLEPATVEQAAFEATGASAEGKDPKALALEIIAKDSKRNVERVRPVIHLWLASETELPTPVQAREAVLESILKIPYKDPYFGLRDVVLPGTAF